MLNVTNRDKTFLNQFFAKNPDISIDIVRFADSEAKAAFDSDFPADACIFIRREYDGVEAYLYMYPTPSIKPVFRKEVKNEKK